MTTSRINRAIDELVLAMPDLSSLGEALERIAGVARAEVPGCTGASATVEAEDTPFTIGASDDLVRDLDTVQYAGGGGPCLDALHTGRTFAISDTSTEPRWPTFVTAAFAAGIHQTLSVPLIVAERTVGVLNLYSSRSEGVVDRGRDAAQALAERAGAAAAGAGLYFDSRALAQGLSRALEFRSVIEQAKGIIMVQNRCDAQAAFRILSTASQNRNLKLRELALQIVASVSAPPDGSGVS